MILFIKTTGQGKTMIRRTTVKQRIFLYTVVAILSLLSFIGLRKCWRSLNNEFYHKPRPAIESDEFEW
jgi:hypothetical protein